jgi:PAS domain S-box-containing protein
MRENAKTREQLIEETQELRRRLSQREITPDTTRLDSLLLDSLPHPTMILQKDRIVLAANRVAKELGAKVGGYCWQDFAHCRFIPEEDKRYMNEHGGEIPPGGTHCTFCLSDKAFAERKPVHDPDVRAFGRLWDVWWIPLDSRAYLHYTIDLTDRKLMEEELRSSHRKLEAETIQRGKAFEKIESLARFPDENPNPVLRVSEDGKLLYANKSSSILLKDQGWEVNRNLPAPWRKTILDVLDSGLGREVEVACAEATYSLVLTPVVGSRYVNIYGKDITERKRAEEALRESEHDLNRAQAVAHTGSWRLHVRRNKLLWSDETYRMFGIPKETELTYETFLTSVHPEDREYVEQRWTAAMHGEPYDIEHRIVAGDEVKWVREKAELEFNEQGALIGGFGTVQDITKRKQMEEDLRRSGELFRNLVEISSQIVWVTDARGEAMEDSPSWRAFTGRTYEQWVGWNWLDVFHPEDRERIAAAWRTSFTRIVPYHIEARMLHASGEYRHVLCQAAPIFNADGSVREWVGMNTDITERKQMEEELRRSRDELAIKVADRTAELVEANAKLQEEVEERKLAQRVTEAGNELLGLATLASSRKEYLDGVARLIRKWSECRCVGIRVLDEVGNIPYESCVGFEREFCQEENRLSLTKDNCACIRVMTGRPEPQDACCMTPGGSFLVNDSARFVEALSEEDLKRFRGGCIKAGFFSVAVIPIRDHTRVVGAIHLADKESGMVPENLVAFIESLTPLMGEAISKFNTKDALKSHYEAKLRLAAIVESSSDGIISRGLDGFITSWNASAERIYGYSASEAIGRPITFIHPPENVAESNEMLRRAAGGERIVNHETVRMRKDGNRIDVSISISPIVNGSGEIVGISSIHRDISDRKLTEQELKGYMEKLELVNRELQDFASIASHDLQEPLRKVRKFSDLVCTRYEKALDDAGKDYLGRMKSAAGRMEALLDALAEYSRVTTRANPFRTSDLTILAEDVVSDLDVLIEQKGATVTVGKLPVAEVDPTQFMRLLQNLISNSLKYNKSEKPDVKVYGEILKNSSLRVCVEDNGIGFDEQYLDRIFQPFQRLHGRSSEYKGTGMGLAICKKIVERHGGSITARSRPGIGSVFEITLPVRQKNQSSFLSSRVSA